MLHVAWMPKIMLDLTSKCRFGIVFCWASFEHLAPVIFVSLSL